MGVAHAEPKLVTCLRTKTLWELRTFSLQYVFCRAPFCLQNLKTESQSILCWGDEMKAVEHLFGSPELSYNLSLRYPLDDFL